MLCGFAKGEIIQWDLENGKVLRTIAKAHHFPAAVCNIKFTDDPSLAVFTDSIGSAFELQFKRAVGGKTCETRCLFSGMKGKVCCVEPLCIKEHSPGHPVSQFSLLAMASLTKLLIVCLKPVLKVMFTAPYGKTGPSSVPLLAWQLVCIKDSMEPLLAFCRGTNVRFFHAKSNGDQVDFPALMEINLQYELTNLKWINDSILLLLDGEDKLHVLDRESQQELEVLDLSALQLVRSLDSSETLETGVTVDQALAFIGETASYQSVCTYGGETAFLGAKSLAVVSLKTWKERIDHLVRQGQYAESLSLAWMFYEGTAKAAIGK
nr:PREDICTED: vacuolar protein sorting-associated protein 8 homolog [Latimeria chalumnae]|eukprot:XP_014352866.1 PREDICTED: vacuolar protein sorting-associated protein 8 homolog [Latimeria chalumnae]